MGHCGEARLGRMFPVISADAEDGNISPGAGEIDSSANLYPSPATGCTGTSFNQTPTAIDWVKDCLANNDLTVGTDAAAKKATGTAPVSSTGSPATTRTSS